ncbi:helix-turn-helix domain-containing protein [Nocardia sp. NPDC055053]
MTTFSKLTWLKRTNGHKFTATEMATLVAIFNYTNEQGKNAFPGMKRLCEDTCRSRGQVSEAVKSLRLRGWITEVSRGSGISGNASRYELIPDAPNPGMSGNSDIGMSGESDMVCPENQTPSDHVTDHLTDDNKRPVFGEEKTRTHENLNSGASCGLPSDGKESDSTPNRIANPDNPGEQSNNPDRLLIGEVTEPESSPRPAPDPDELAEWVVLHCQGLTSGEVFTRCEAEFGGAYMTYVDMLRGRIRLTGGTLQRA